MPKGRINRPKAKEPHHHPVFKNCFTKGEKLFKLQKTLLIAKRRISLGGVFI
jgi:hypothetical protein